MPTFRASFRFANHNIALVGLIAIRDEIVRLLPIAAVDLRLVLEAHNVNGVLGFDFELIQLLWLN